MIDFTTIPAEIANLADEGGWVFFALVALAFGIAFALLSLWSATRLPDAPILSPESWRALLMTPDPAAAVPQKLNLHLSRSSDRATSLAEIARRLFAKSERRFPFAFLLISAAPLIGLLGTVSGMFKTFRGTSAEAVAAPIDVISAGISEALITTQTGLIIGVPTFIICAWLKSRHDELVLRYSRLESALIQSPGPAASTAATNPSGDRSSRSLF